MKVDEMFQTPTKLPKVKIADARYPDMKKFLKLAGYKLNTLHSNLNNGRKDELFNNALVFDKNLDTPDADTFFARKDGTVLDFDTYTWVPWLHHPDMMDSAKKLGLLKTTDNGSKVELDKLAFRRKGLHLNGEN